MRLCTPFQKWSGPMVCLLVVAGVRALAEDPRRFPAMTRLEAGRGGPASAAFPSYRKVDPDYRHAGEAALERWMDWKWGLRIHWGSTACSTAGSRGSSTSHLKTTSEWQKKYYASYQQFNPTGFNADEWMEIMQRAGMKYFSFTSKHHEGFCMWPTKTLQKGFRKKADGSYEDVIDHYSIVETPYKRDIIGEAGQGGPRPRPGREPLLLAHRLARLGFRLGQRANFWYDAKFTKKSRPEALGGLHPEGARPDHRTADLVRADRHALPGHRAGPRRPRRTPTAWPGWPASCSRTSCSATAASATTAITKRPKARFPKIRTK